MNDSNEVVAADAKVIEQNTSGVVGVLAEALAKHDGQDENGNVYDDFYDCSCGDWHSDIRSYDERKAAHLVHVASVIAALPNIAIVPTTSVEYAPCWQNEHGVHPLNSTTTWRKGAEDDVERLRADDPEIFLGEHYRTPWVAARAAGGQA